MPASPDLRSPGFSMDRLPIVHPGANTKAVFRERSRRNPQFTAVEHDSHEGPLRNFTYGRSDLFASPDVLREMQH